MKLDEIRFEFTGYLCYESPLGQDDFVGEPKSLRLTAPLHGIAS